MYIHIVVVSIYVYVFVVLSFFIYLFRKSLVVFISPHCPPPLTPSDSFLFYFIYLFGFLFNQHFFIYFTCQSLFLFPFLQFPPPASHLTPFSVHSSSVSIQKEEDLTGLEQSMAGQGESGLRSSPYIRAGQGNQQSSSV